MPKKAIRIEDHPHHKAREHAVNKVVEAHAKAHDKTASIKDKKFKHLTPKEKDDLLHALALKAGLLESDD